MKYQTNQKITRTKYLAAMGALVLSLALPQSVLAASVVASNGSIKLPAKDSIEAPGFVTLENTTDQEIVVIKIRSSAFKMAMVNQAIKDNDQARELLRPDLVLKPNSKLVMKKDGVHLLFAGPNIKLKAGKSVTANFYLSNSEKLSIEFKIVK